jgi:alcohol dehydrogenase class IV
LEAVTGVQTCALPILGISYKLSDYGVPQEEIPAIAKAAIGAVRLISNNPRKVLEKEVIKLLEGNY